MDIPKHIRDTIANPPTSTTPSAHTPTTPKRSALPDLTHHEDFVMRMFFMRYPKNMDWNFCIHMMDEGKEDHYFTRWAAYNHLPVADLVGEMESMLSDLRQEFTSNKLTLPSPLNTPFNRALNSHLGDDAWELITRTINPLNNR